MRLLRCCTSDSIVNEAIGQDRIVIMRGDLHGVVVTSAVVVT